MNQEMPEWLKVSDVARLLQLCSDTVYRWCRAGRLPYVRLGRTIRFRREAIEALLQARERRKAQ